MTTVLDKTCKKTYEEAMTGLLLNRSFYYVWISQMIYTEEPSIYVAAVGPNTITGTFKLYINPANFLRFNVAGRMFILQHEVMHVIYEHFWSAAREHRFWGKAADLFINSTLMEKEGLKMPEDPDSPGFPSGLTIEDTCQQIEALWAKIGTPRTLDRPPAAQTPEFYCSWLDSVWPPRPESEDQSWYVLRNEPSHPDQNVTEIEKKIIKAMVAAGVANALKVTPPPSHIAGDLTDLLESVKPRISLRSKLRKFVGRMGSIRYRASLGRVNKYGEVGRLIPEFSLKVLVVVDTSASMDNEEVAEGLGLLEEMSAYVEIDYMPVDTKVHGPYPFKKRGDHRYKVEGRGWTDLRAAFWWMRDNKKVYDAVIVWTDMGTEFPTREERMGIPTLWVATADGTLPPGAGEVIHLSSVLRNRSNNQSNVDETA